MSIDAFAPFCMPPEVRGLVGIFDALGAKNFDAHRVRAFIEAQDAILEAIRDKANIQSLTRDIPTPKLFTFNDTLIIALEASAENEYDAIKGFGVIVRRLISFSLQKKLLFRGAVSIGKYITDERRSLIMGEAVTDAASWYEQFELVGGFATPKASLIIKRHTSTDSRPPYHYVFPYDVPCKQGKRQLVAFNWPKAFFVHGLRPPECQANQEEACLLSLLTQNEMPIGTELKYQNTVEFFKAAPKQDSE